MPAFGTDDPAEERIGSRLHQPLTLDHPFAVLGIDALAGIDLQDGRVGLLDLQEERVVGDRHHQRHHAQGPDAADADHFDGYVHQAIMVEQNALVLAAGVFNTLKAKGLLKLDEE
jgi:hypothetical protein